MFPVIFKGVEGTQPRVHYRTHNILRAFRTRIPGKVDFIYVDEVQDLLIIDTKRIHIPLTSSST